MRGVLGMVGGYPHAGRGLLAETAPLSRSVEYTLTGFVPHLFLDEVRSIFVHECEARITERDRRAEIKPL